jgi:hypothetical protein
MHIFSSLTQLSTVTNTLQLILFTLCIVAFSLWVRRVDFLPRNTEECADLQLGFIRFLTCSICLFLVVRDNPLQTLTLPTEWVYPRTFIHLLFGSSWIYIIRSDLYLQGIWYGAVFSLTCGALGLFTRVSLATGSVTFLLLYDIFSSYTHLFHTGLLPLQLLLILTFLPCGDRISLDKVRSRKNFPTSVNDTTYRYGLYLCWIVYAMAYLNAGLSKMGAGVQWFSPLNILGYTIADSLSLIQYDFNLTPLLARLAPDWIFSLGALSAVAIECSALFLLVNYRATRIIPVLIGGLHLLIFTIHEFPFFDLLFLPLMFFPVSRVLKKECEPKNLKMQAPPLPNTGWALCCSILAAILISPQLHKVKFYPIFDTWDMYAIPQLEHHTSYYKVFVKNRDGSRYRTDFQDTFSMFREAKWQDVLLADQADGFIRLQKLLPNILRQHPEMKSIEIERWRWNFASDRVNGSDGTLEQSWTVGL